MKFPEATLILCADDDVATDGNPGLTKARAAAVAVGGKLAIPIFAADRPEGATDFNDLAALEGIEAVARNVVSANPPQIIRTQPYERPIFYTKRNRALLRARFAFIPNSYR
jgi:putative DNA primase/helicase